MGIRVLGQGITDCSEGPATGFIALPKSHQVGGRATCFKDEFSCLGSFKFNRDSQPMCRIGEAKVFIRTIHISEFTGLEMGNGIGNRTLIGLIFPKGSVAA